MSPQSRAAAAHATFVGNRRDDEMSGNACPASSSVAALAQAANVEYALHKIESESSAATQALDGTGPPSPSRKRSCPKSSTHKNQPFLSSYGSAFLSGIFADIADAAMDGEEAQDPSATGELQQPAPKKARTAASTSLGRLKSRSEALSSLAAGPDVHEVSSPSVVVSPRPNMSAPKIQRLNQAQVQELQDLAFPSLPRFPHAVSTSSLSSGAFSAASPRARSLSEGMAVDRDDGDSPESYGWFVSMDGEDDDQDRESPATSMFLPDTKPADLAFRAPCAPAAPAGEQDLEVQQALAADTIDDVLGDLF